MLNISIDVSDLIAKLNALGNDATLGKDIADAVADEAVIPEVAKYPAQAHRKQPFKSSTQRRAFFAKMRAGAITVPYRRTGALGGSAVKQPFQSGVAVAWTAPYSDIVIGEKQAGYFSNWSNVSKVAAKIEGDTAELIGTAEVVKRLREAGLL